MDKASDVLKSIEKIAEKRFIPSIGPVKGKILFSFAISENA